MALENLCVRPSDLGIVQKQGLGQKVVYQTGRSLWLPPSAGRQRLPTMRIHRIRERGRRAQKQSAKIFLCGGRLCSLMLLVAPTSMVSYQQKHRSPDFKLICFCRCVSSRRSLAVVHLPNSDFGTDCQGFRPLGPPSKSERLRLRKTAERHCITKRNIKFSS